MRSKRDAECFVGKSGKFMIKTNLRNNYPSGISSHSKKKIIFTIDNFFFLVIQEPNGPKKKGLFHLKRNEKWPTENPSDDNVTSRKVSDDLF